VLALNCPEPFYLLLKLLIFAGNTHPFKLEFFELGRCMLIKAEEIIVLRNSREFLLVGLQLVLDCLIVLI
jgi:hypothetical protein